ncbi:MAG: sigma factor-like helix-turn-helix DNA-binding protein [Oscillospiraceae bacterium]|nr:sigma factor-like helix-turn-helix DNA-binding protein [Oscillospiraceae bacterium]
MSKNLEMVYLIDAYSSALTEKQRDMLELYYCEDLSLAEIAQNSGISRQGVRDCIKRGEAAMLELEDTLGLARRNRLLSEVFEGIRSRAEEIIEQNDAFEIKRLAGEIIEKTAVLEGGA